MRKVMFIVFALMALMMVSMPAFAQEAGGAASTHGNYVAIAAGFGIAIAAGLAGLGQGRVGAAPVIERLQWAKQHADLHTNLLGQATVQEMGARGWLDKWIRKSCKVYARKQDVLRRAISGACHRTFKSFTRMEACRSGWNCRRSWTLRNFW